MYDRDIVMAILDSYITIRINGHMLGWNRGWNDFELGKTAPRNPDVINKLKAIRSLVDALPNSEQGDASYTFSWPNNSKPWFNFLYLCMELEIAEQDNKMTTRGKFFGLGALFSAEEARLEQAIRAIRAFIVTKMNTLPEKTHNYLSSDLDDTIAALLADKNSLQSEYNSLKSARHPVVAELRIKEAALKKTTMQYNALVQAKPSKDHIIFFNELTKKRDIRQGLDNKPLKEETFDDFCNNVRTSARVTTNLNKLMAMDASLLEPSAKNSLSTPSARAANALHKPVTAQPETAAAPMIRP